jgi:hypothetical protein
VYAGHHSEIPNSLSSSKCEPTKHVTDASLDFAILGRPNVTFSVENPPAVPKSSSRLRAYGVGGLAAYGNILRHPTERAAWSYVTGPSVVLAVFGLVAFAVGVTIRKRRSAIESGAANTGAAFSDRRDPCRRCVVFPELMVQSVFVVTRRFLGTIDPLSAGRNCRDATKTLARRSGVNNRLQHLPAVPEQADRVTMRRYKETWILGMQPRSGHWSRSSYL